MGHKKLNEYMIYLVLFALILVWYLSSYSAENQDKEESKYLSGSTSTTPDTDRITMINRSYLAQYTGNSNIMILEMGVLILFVYLDLKARIESR